MRRNKMYPDEIIRPVQSKMNALDALTGMAEERQIQECQERYNKGCPGELIAQDNEIKLYRIYRGTGIMPLYYKVGADEKVFSVRAYSHEDSRSCVAYWQGFRTEHLVCNQRTLVLEMWEVKGTL